MPVTDYYDYQDLFEECGCCGHFHRPEFRGDCRNDLERFSASDLEEQFTRRAELDHELQAMGAVVIRVEDLGKALEARRRGGLAIQWATHPKALGRELCYGMVAGIEAADAAHLARLALGESS